MDKTMVYYHCWLSPNTAINHIKHGHSPAWFTPMVNSHGFLTDICCWLPPVRALPAGRTSRCGAAQQVPREKAESGCGRCNQKPASWHNHAQPKCGSLPTNSNMGILTYHQSSGALRCMQKIGDFSNPNLPRINSFVLVVTKVGDLSDRQSRFVQVMCSQLFIP